MKSPQAAYDRPVTSRLFHVSAWPGCARRTALAVLLVFVSVALQAPHPLAQAPAGAQPAPASPAIDPQATLPFDAAVRTGRLPNGLTFYVRHNERPLHRVSLRLAVNAGSLDEADDQQGLAHFLEHMAFNGSAHFEPGKLVSYFESVGARLGPHVNAYTSFEETVYMLDLPTDKPEIVQQGLTALADIAGGLTLDPVQIDKERGVVIEEWRGGLGAATRIRDQQIPVLYFHSHYAERIPIGKPEVIRTAPPARLRAFYDAHYRPDRIAVVAVGDIDVSGMQSAVASHFASLTARGPEPPPRDDAVPFHDETLFDVATDPELQRSSVSVIRKRPRGDEARVSSYRHDLVQRLIEHMLDERFEEIARRPDAPFLGASAGGSRMSPGVESFALGAGTADGHLTAGLTALVVEANRARQHGFGAGEIDRARRWMAAFYERAYAERDKTESGSFAREYVSHFLHGEPSPGIEYERRLALRLLADIAPADISSLTTELLADRSRVALAVSPKKDGIAIPAADDLRRTIDAAERAAVTPWTDATSTRAIMEQRPEPAGIVSRRELHELGVTVVRFANGLEAWLKPTDFKNDEILFTLSAKGGSSLAAPSDYLDAALSASYVDLSGAGGLKALDIERLLAGKLVSASPFVSLSTHGVAGSSTPAELETALQLVHQELAAPGDDPDAFALLTRQLQAAVANRTHDPQRLFQEKIAQITSSNHYTAQPVTTERVAALDRAAMLAFYRAHFSNARDFTLFMVGAFSVDETLPLLASYMGTLPSTNAAASTYRDVGIRFPSAVERATVTAGSEPRGQAVIAFSADPSADPREQEAVSAAATVLEISLRDMLREELGQTYGVSVRLVQRLPQRGGGFIRVQFGADPANLQSMVDRVLAEVGRLRRDGPGADLTGRAKAAARRANETVLRQNGYWLGRLQSAYILARDPAELLHRPEAIDAVSPASVQNMFTRYFPLDRFVVVTLRPE
jgi:zinc protease